MRRFLGRGRKPSAEGNFEGGENLRPVSSPSKSLISSNTKGSIEEIIPMFGGGSINEPNSEGPSNTFTFRNDPDLGINPSISNVASTEPSLFTRGSERKEKSIFSSGKKTFSTKQSSYFSKKSNPSNKAAAVEYGQPLQILDIPEEPREVSKTPEQAISDKLHMLFEDCSFIINEYNSSPTNLTTTVVNIIDRLKDFVTFVSGLEPNSHARFWNFNTYNNTDVRRLMKIYLHFYDNLLSDEVYIKLKLLLIKNFNAFIMSINPTTTDDAIDPMKKPQNFAVGSNKEEVQPNEEVVQKIMKKISATTISIKEQNGSFIAPICRGVSQNMNVLCLYFGYPNPSDYHLKFSRSLHNLYDDIHFLVCKNHIDVASTKVSSNPYPDTFSKVGKPSNTSPTLRKFKLPFRMPTEETKPPMSLSLSIENSKRTSGTMGGFIYPKIDLKKQPHLKSYSNAKFAISCGHVCLDNNQQNVEYPHVSAPSSVLINLYKQALIAQYRKLDDSNDYHSHMEAKVAYGSALEQLNEIFPLKRVKVIDPKTSEDEYEVRNMPKNSFGQIIWGERNLIDKKIQENDNSKVVKKLSDLAIIKVSKNLECDQNFLGDDIAFNEFDPGLMFDNLYVRAVVDLSREMKDDDLDLTQIDSRSSSEDSLRGLPVFKYGSTTKLTKGILNGIKLVYWLDGALHSSEFVVNSCENNSAFASGGDSGAWVLTKIEDCPTIPGAKGLGAVGMLHSYDGEFKQFGLFTPMREILERLEEVTSIQWNVVGVTEKGDLDDVESEIEESDSEDNATVSSKSESEVDLQSINQIVDETLTAVFSATRLSEVE